MIAFPAGVRVWIAGGVTDMRRGMNTLALQVQEGLGRDPHAGEIFCFRGRRGKPPTFCIRFRVARIAYRWHPLFGRTVQVSPFRRGKELTCIYTRRAA